MYLKRKTADLNWSKIHPTKVNLFILTTNAFLMYIISRSILFSLSNQFTLLCLLVGGTPNTNQTHDYRANSRTSYSAYIRFLRSFRDSWTLETRTQHRILSCYLGTRGNKNNSFLRVHALEWESNLESSLLQSDAVRLRCSQMKFDSENTVNFPSVNNM